MANELKRWHHTLAGHVTDEAGAWIKFSDHEAGIAHERKKAAKLVEALEELSEFFGREDYASYSHATRQTAREALATYKGSTDGK